MAEKWMSISEEGWDHLAVQCGNCSVQIIARGGSNKRQNGQPNMGLSDTGSSEDEALCGLCAGQQMYQYADQMESREAAMREALGCAEFEKADHGPGCQFTSAEASVGLLPMVCDCWKFRALAAFSAQTLRT